MVCQPLLRLANMIESGTHRPRNVGWITSGVAVWKALSLAKSDTAGQKATASFLVFDLTKCAKHWQPRGLTNFDHAFRRWQGVC